MKRKRQEEDGDNDLQKILDNILKALDEYEAEDVKGYGPLVDGALVELEGFADRVESGGDGGAGFHPGQVETLLEACIETGKRDAGKKGAKLLRMSKMQSVKFWKYFVPCRPLNPDSLVSRFAVWLLGSSFAISTVEPAVHWLYFMVRHKLVSPSHLLLAYESIFTNLRRYQIREVLCCILCKLSRRHHVTKWRVSYLKRIRDKYGSFLQLERLLSKFKLLRPKRVDFALVNYKSPSMMGKRGDIFKKIWNNVDPEEDFNNNYDLEGFDNFPSKRRQKEGEILQDDEEEKSTTTLRDCKNAGEVIEKLTELTLPEQALSILEDPKGYLLLLLHPKRRELKERLSITLYHMLHYEFFTKESGSLKKKSQLLQKVHNLEAFLQQGIPVVGRFLSEFLADKNWDGKSLILEVLRLLVHLPILDHEVLHDLILSPIMYHFNSTWHRFEQLIVLTYIHQLLSNWISVEYFRCLHQLGMNEDGTIADCQYDPKGSDGSFLENPLDHNQRQTKRSRRNSYFVVKNKRAHTFFPSATPENPLKSIMYLMEWFQQQVDNGLAKSALYRPHHEFCTDVKHPKYYRKNPMFRLEVQSFTSEVQRMYIELERVLVAKRVPIMPKIPISLMYESLFGNSCYQLQQLLDYLTFARKELQAVCQEKHSCYLETGRKEFAEAIKTNADMGSANALTQDAVLVFSKDTCIPRHEHSIFRSHWRIEEDYVLRELGLDSHPALLPLIVKFAKNPTGGKKGYVTCLQEHCPQLLEFMAQFKP